MRVVTGERRATLLAIAADLFARRGYANTTIRDIAEVAAMTSGSLYHHFDSKESILDELLRDFQGRLFARYDEILGSDADPIAKIEAVLRASFEAIDQHRNQIAIREAESLALSTSERFGYLEDDNRRFRLLWTILLEEAVDAGAVRADIDVAITYRYIRDTVWLSAHWFQKERDGDAQRVAEEYVSLLLRGIVAPTDEQN